MKSVFSILLESGGVVRIVAVSIGTAGLITVSCLIIPGPITRLIKPNVCLETRKFFCHQWSSTLLVRIPVYPFKRFRRLFIRFINNNFKREKAKRFHNSKKKEGATHRYISVIHVYSRRNHSAMKLKSLNSPGTCNIN